MVAIVQALDGAGLQAAAEARIAGRESQLLRVSAARDRGASALGVAPWTARRRRGDGDDAALAPGSGAPGRDPGCTPVGSRARRNDASPDPGRRGVLLLARGRHQPYRRCRRCAAGGCGKGQAARCRITARYWRMSSATPRPFPSSDWPERGPSTCVTCRGGRPTTFPQASARRDGPSP